MQSQNKIYCPAIYHGLYIEKTSSDSARISSCCLNDSTEVSGTINFDHPYLADQRSAFDRQEKITQCNQCWNKETVGLESRRQVQIDWYKNISALPGRIVSLDYNIDPICNAACIMCGPYFSSLWLAENQKHGDDTVFRRSSSTKKNLMVQDLDLSDLRFLYFNGGEPLLTQDHSEILKRISQSKQLADLKVSYNTNGSVMPDSDVIELWKQCQEITVNISIDGTGSVFEYVRYPLSWVSVQENISKLAHLTDVNLIINISVTVGLHNLLDIVDIENWFNQTRSIDPARFGDFCVHTCHGVLSLENSEPELKSYFRDYLNSLSNPWAPALSNALDQVNKDPGSWTAWLEKLDQRRGLDWKISLPRLYQAKKSLDIF